ncbi:tripartite tricarboxylate transporter permease [Limisalsivibrio acetivorans]|uniref:tripartite tricarboxylate transporter permease n=1 Tax=Limisalsivibrio acetivorans TaxID=1304888 RepID=UPI0003B32D85|nr:tripartite tricarboxylate transporter permease [Limisalsivibrio acetivorans]
MDYVSMLEGIKTVLEPRIIQFLVAGLLFGFIIGAIPGFNDTNVLALVLPFTVYLGPMQAVMFMMAVFCGSQAGGSVPAILMNIPGTPSNAPTCIEGFAMTKKGMAGEALGASLAASTIGGLISAVVCFVIAPIIGVYALSFGPAEMFMVAVFGLTAVGSLTGKSVSKGLLSSAFGLLLATVGTEIQVGYTRSSFGLFELYEGFPLIPVLLGLFGFSELITMVNEKSIIQEGKTSFKGYSSLFEGMKKAVSMKLNLIRSSVIGIIIGLIPGTGAAIATWISYGQSKQWSKTPEKFGTGDYEGLAASDACNNGVTGGALIPTLTLGIPGSGTTLIIMAALMINGIQPGPSLFVEFKTEAYAIFASIVLVNIVMFFAGLVIFRFLPHLSSIPTVILVPIISLFCLVGGFAYRELLFDMTLVVIFGLFGALLKKYGYSIPAMLLALILGPLAEKNLFWVLQLGGLKLFMRPISFVILIMTLLTLFLPIYLSKMKKTGTS